MLSIFELYPFGVVCLPDKSDCSNKEVPFIAIEGECVCNELPFAKQGRVVLDFVVFFGNVTVLQAELDEGGDWRR